MSKNTMIDRVTALVTPILDDLGLDLYDIEFGGGQLTVTIDTRLPGTAADPEAPSRLAARIAADERESARAAAAADDDDDAEDGDEPADGEAAEPTKRGPGITLDMLALATRLISRELDHADPIPGHYTLEVSSPGLERSLRTPAHFHRSLGSEVAVRLRDVAKDERRVQGVLSAAGDDAFTVTRADGTQREIPYDQVDRARTIFNWGPPPKPAKGKPKRQAPPRKQSISTPTAATDDTTEAPAP